MTKTALLKLLLAIMIMFILILPEYFQAPKGNMLELSCLEVYLQQNFSYSFFSINASFVTFLQPIKETQTITGIFLNHSNFQNFTRICQDITSELKTCFSCLACESKGNTDFIFQEQTSKVLIMRGSMEVKSNNFHSPCQHFNFTVTPTVDHLEEYNLTCNLKTHTGRSAIKEEDPTEATSINRTCRIMEHPHNCINISFHLEMDAKSHKYEPTSTLLRGSDSEKLRTLNVRVISAETTKRLPMTPVKDVLPPIPELEVTSAVPQQDQHTRLSL
ncbi:PREDICTED: transmembrane protein 156 isoform X3 [Bison bison bison]|uniref:Transmembrane protein 156 isoform X3 n=1 Tax=Bison bison bison TaxID=43346 RepID=A0A6P3GYC7_BISBB|nr:PREDICTED: transmembrane protein 156 isoform X3 [Bison bison bison]XP_019818153.1 PREDICTED: transmembrane protein 156 isoform X3 [Bos indicus]XP_027400082.1 transmembrane protein 156 isoform X3 [Bos indicus x Bos taurus]